MLSGCSGHTGEPLPGQGQTGGCLSTGGQPLCRLWNTVSSHPPGTFIVLIIWTWVSHPSFRLYDSFSPNAMGQRQTGPPEEKPPQALPSTFPTLSSRVNLHISNRPSTGRRQAFVCHFQGKLSINRDSGTKASECESHSTPISSVTLANI